MCNSIECECWRILNGAFIFHIITDNWVPLANCVRTHKTFEMFAESSGNNVLAAGSRQFHDIFPVPPECISSELDWVLDCTPFTWQRVSNFVFNFKIFVFGLRTRSNDLDVTADTLRLQMAILIRNTHCWTHLLRTDVRTCLAAALSCIQSQKKMYDIIINCWRSESAQITLHWLITTVTTAIVFVFVE